MARARILKPGFFTNEVLAELPFAGRLLFAGLWTIADREGRLEDRPRRIKVALFPWDEVDVPSLLIALEDKGFIDRYTVNGMALIQVAKFYDHQKPHPREPGSLLPEPPAEILQRQASDPRPDLGGAWPDSGRVRPSGIRYPVSGDPVSGDSVEALTRSTPAAAIRAFLVFPVVGTGQKHWDLMESQLHIWADLYPDLDIPAEARKALAWIDAKPSRRKTDRGMKAFLVNWLNRATNQGGARSSTDQSSAGVPVGSKRVQGLIAGGAAFLRSRRERE